MKRTSLMDLNLDVLSMIMYCLDQSTLLHLIRTCKLARRVGTHAIVVDVQVELHRLSSFAAFMLSPTNQTRLPPLLRRLVVKEDHLDVVLAKLEQDSSAPEKELAMLYSVAAQSLAQLFRYTSGLNTLDIVGLEYLLEKLDDGLMHNVWKLPSLHRIHLYSPGPRCESLLRHSNRLTHVTIAENPVDEEELFVEHDFTLLTPVSGTLTHVSLRDVPFDNLSGAPVQTFPFVTSLHLFNDSDPLHWFLKLFPNVQRLTLENSAFDVDHLLAAGRTSIRSIDSISTDWAGLAHISSLCLARSVSVIYNENDAVPTIEDHVRRFIQCMEPCVLSLAMPPCRQSAKHLGRLARALPATLKCLDLTLADVEFVSYTNDVPFLSTFKTSSPLRYLHITLALSAPHDRLEPCYWATASMLRSLLDGSFVHTLAEGIPTLQFVTLLCPDEGWDLMSWRICSLRDAWRPATVQRMGTHEGHAMKAVSFSVSELD